MSTLKAGFSKVEITAWEHELAMMGWGRMDNRIVGVAQPLFVRAAVFEAGGTRLAYVCLELMAVSWAIREAVLERLRRDHGELGLDAANVLLTASHTHSGPSGYSHHFFINLNGPGFSRRVFETAVDGTVEAIVNAAKSLKPAQLELGSGEMPLHEPVAFNRSWFAYNRNEDVEPVTEDRRDEAVDRTMTVLVARAAGEPLGCVVWYPVHCTSVHAENDRLHPDNKGLAAIDMERQFGDGFVSVFAQEAAGDVTPNYRYDRARKKVVGRFDDDYASAQYNADAQRRLAVSILRRTTVLSVGTIESTLHTADFSAIEVAPRFSHGQPDARTTTGTLGLSMAEGTDEGPGPILGLRRLNRWLTRRLKGRGDVDPKVPMIDVGNGLDAHFLGRFSVRAFKIPRLDPTFAYIREKVLSGRLDEGPWIAQVLQLQLMRLGELLIVGIPFEVTTVAGRRIRALLRECVEGVERVVISSYSNGYAGYCTTFEEYQLQHYEAGYTLFGPHQLGALMTRLEAMAGKFPDGIDDDAAPYSCPPEALECQFFEEPWPVPRATPTWA